VSRRSPLAVNPAAAGALLLLVACSALPAVPAERVAGLMRGYPELYRHMVGFGCPRCHTTGAQFLANQFKLPPPGENDDAAVRMLWRLLDAASAADARLVRKPSGELGHRGGKILNREHREEWIAAIDTWTGQKP
jgi:hypothetical protein